MKSRNEPTIHNPNGLTHGYSNTRLYQIYHSMLYRCNNPKCSIYKRYGGRGINVCDEWQHDFQAFMVWALNHGYTDKLTIDRIDVNGDYSPNNCRWADKKAQMNNKRNNHFIEYKGESHTLSEWETITGISQKTLERRFANGWTIEEALTLEPNHTSRKNRKH